MILKPGITARRDLWSPLANKMGEENWLLLMDVLMVQGFSETTSADVKRAQEALESAGLGLIEDELQLARLLRALHFYYIPSIAKRLSSEIDTIHKDTLATLLTTKSAGYWGFIGYFESAYYRLQQNFVEKNITGLQNYLRCYCECEEKYGKLICGSEQSESVPLLHRVGDGNLSYQIWGLSRDYENIVHQALNEDWFQGLLAIITASITHEHECNWGNFNQRNRFGDAPIHIAARTLSILPFKHLMRVPALDVEVKDGSGKNVLHLIFLRVQIRWNRLRALRSGDPVGSLKRLDPAESDIVELVDAILNKAASPLSMLLDTDNGGISVMEYSLGLRSNRLLLVLLSRLDRNTASQYLDTSQRVHTLMSLLRSSLLYNQYDMVFSLARLVLQICHSTKTLTLTKTPTNPPTPASFYAQGRGNGLQQSGTPSRLLASSTPGTVSQHNMVDLLLFCLQQGLHHSLQALLSVAPPAGSTLMPFASLVNHPGSATGMWTGGPDQDEISLVRARCPNMLPLEMAVGATFEHENDNISLVHSISQVRSLHRVGAKTIVKLAQNKVDNLFALAASHGNVEMMRSLMLAAEANDVSSHIARNIRVLPSTNGFYIEHIFLCSNPLVLAIVNGHHPMLRYLLHHTPFSALVNQASIPPLGEASSLCGRRSIGSRGSKEAFKYIVDIYKSTALTPLAAACLLGDSDAVELIVASGGLKDVPVHMPHAGIKFPEFTKEVKAIDNGIDQELTALRTALQNVHHDIASRAPEAGIDESDTEGEPYSIRMVASLVDAADLACKEAMELREWLLSLTTHHQYALLRAGTNKGIPSVKKFLISLIMVLKGGQLIRQQSDPSEIQTRASRRAKSFSVSVSSVSRDWARVIFGSPSLFENMVDFTERLLGHIRIALVQKDGRNMITFSLSAVRRYVKEGLSLCKDSKIKYQWRLHIKDSRCRSLLNLMETWMDFVSRACALFQSASDKWADHMYVPEGYAEMQSAAEPYLMLQKAQVDFNTKLNNAYFMSSCLLPVQFLFHSSLSCNLQDQKRMELVRLMMPKNPFSSCLGRDYGWWWDIPFAAAVRVQALPELLATAHGQKYSAPHPVKATNQSASRAAAASVASLARIGAPCVMSEFDWDLLRQLSDRIMKEERHPQRLLDACVKVGGYPPAGTYLDFCKAGFTVGARGNDGWIDLGPLLHAIHAVDADSFLVLLLNSPFVCPETEDGDESDIVHGHNKDQIKGRKGKRSKADVKREQRRRKKMARRRHKELIAYTISFWESLRTELTKSLRRIDFDSLCTSSFNDGGHEQAINHASKEVSTNNVELSTSASAKIVPSDQKGPASKSLQERAAVIAEVIEISRQTNLELLRGQQVEKADEFIGDAILRSIREQNNDPTINDEGASMADYHYSLQDPTEPTWRKIRLGERNYVEILSKRRKSGRSYLYDVSDSANPVDIYSSFIFCRDGGDQPPTLLGVNGKPVPDCALSWVETNFDVLADAKAADQVASSWDTTTISGLFLCLPRAPRDVVGRFHEPLVENLARNGSVSTLRSLLSLPESVLGDSVPIVKEQIYRLSLVAAHSTNYRAMDTLLWNLQSRYHAFPTPALTNDAGILATCPSSLGSYTNRVPGGSPPCLTKPSSADIQVHIPSYLSRMRTHCVNNVTRSSIEFEAFVTACENLPSSALKTHEQATISDESVNTGYKTDFRAVLRVMHSTHALMRCQESVQTLLSLSKGGETTAGSSFMTMSENHNPNDSDRIRLSWLRMRSEVISTVLQCCKISNGKGLVDFHRRLTEHPLDTVYILCRNTKKRLKNLVYNLPQLHIHDAVNEHRQASERTAHCWEGIFHDKSFPDAQVPYLWRQWLFSLGQLIGSEFCCDSMLQCMLELEMSLLHNVSEETDDILHLGQSLATGLNGDIPVSAAVVNSGRACSFQWLNKAQATLVRKFRADCVLEECERVIEFVTQNTSLVPQGTVAAAILPLLCFSSADLQTAVLGASPDLDTSTSSGGLQSCRRLLQPVLEALLGHPMKDMLSGADRWAVSPSSPSTFAARLLAGLQDSMNKPLDNSRREAIKGTIKALESAIKDDILPGFAQPETFLKLEGVPIGEAVALRQGILIQMKICLHMSVACRAVVNAIPSMEYQSISRGLIMNTLGGREQVVGLAVLLTAIRTQHLRTVQTALRAVQRGFLVPPPSLTAMVLRVAAAQGSVGIFVSVFSALADCRREGITVSSTTGFSQNSILTEEDLLSSSPVTRSLGSAVTPSTECIWSALHAALTGWEDLDVAQWEARGGDLWSIGCLSARDVALLHQREDQERKADGEEDPLDYYDSTGSDSEGLDAEESSCRRADPGHSSVSRSTIVAALLNRNHRLWGTKGRGSSRQAYIKLSTLLKPCLYAPAPTDTEGIGEGKAKGEREPSQDHERHSHSYFTAVDLLASTGSWSSLIQALRIVDPNDELDETHLDPLGGGQKDSNDTNKVIEGQSGDGTNDHGDHRDSTGRSALLEEMSKDATGILATYPYFPFLHAAMLNRRKDILFIIRHFLARQSKMAQQGILAAQNCLLFCRSLLSSSRHFYRRRQKGQEKIGNSTHHAEGALSPREDAREGISYMYRHSLLHDAMASGDETMCLELIKVVNSAYQACEHHDWQDTSLKRRVFTKSLLHYAIYYGHSQVLHALLEGELGVTRIDTHLHLYSMKAALPVPGVDAYLWTPLQLSAYISRQRSHGCVTALLNHLSWPLEPGGLLEAPEAAQLALDLASSLSICIRAGADASATSIFRHLMKRPAGTDAYALQRIFPSLFGEEATVDVETESLMTARTPEESYTTLLLTAAKAGMATFLRALFEFEHTRSHTKRGHAYRSREEGRYQLKAFLAMLIEEAVGRGHAEVAEVVLTRARSEEIFLDLSGLSEPQAMSSNTLKKLGQWEIVRKALPSTLLSELESVQQSGASEIQTGLDNDKKEGTHTETHGQSDEENRPKARKLVVLRCKGGKTVVIGGKAEASTGSKS